MTIASEIFENPEDLFEDPPEPEKCEFASGCGAKPIDGFNLCFDHATKGQLACTVENITEELRLERKNVRDQAETIKSLLEDKENLKNAITELARNVRQLQSAHPWQILSCVVIGAASVLVATAVVLQIAR